MSEGNTRPQIYNINELDKWPVSENEYIFREIAMPSSELSATEISCADAEINEAASVMLVVDSAFNTDEKETCDEINRIVALAYKKLSEHCDTDVFAVDNIFRMLSKGKNADYVPEIEEGGPGTNMKMLADALRETFAGSIMNFAVIYISRNVDNLNDPADVMNTISTIARSCTNKSVSINCVGYGDDHDPYALELLSRVGNVHGDYYPAQNMKDLERTVLSIADRIITKKNPHIAIATGNNKILRVVEAGDRYLLFGADACNKIREGRVIEFNSHPMTAKSTFTNNAGKCTADSNVIRVYNILQLGAIVNAIKLDLSPEQTEAVSGAIATLKDHVRDELRRVSNKTPNSRREYIKFLIAFRNIVNECDNFRALQMPEANQYFSIARGLFDLREMSSKLTVELIPVDNTSAPGEIEVFTSDGKFMRGISRGELDDISTFRSDVLVELYEDDIPKLWGLVTSSKVYLIPRDGKFGAELLTNVWPGCLSAIRSGNLDFIKKVMDFYAQLGECKSAPIKFWLLLEDGYADYTLNNYSSTVEDIISAHKLIKSEPERVRLLEKINFVAKARTENRNILPIPELVTKFADSDNNKLHATDVVPQKLNQFKQLCEVKGVKLKKLPGRRQTSSAIPDIVQFAFSGGENGDVNTEIHKIIDTAAKKLRNDIVNPYTALQMIIANNPNAEMLNITDEEQIKCNLTMYICEQIRFIVESKRNVESFEKRSTIMLKFASADHVYKACALLKGTFIGRDISHFLSAMIARKAGGVDDQLEKFKLRLLIGGQVSVDESGNVYAGCDELGYYSRDEIRLKTPCTIIKLVEDVDKATFTEGDKVRAAISELYKDEPAKIANKLACADNSNRTGYWKIGRRKRRLVSQLFGRVHGYL